MTRRLAVVFLVAALCSSALAADDPAQRVRDALQALSADDAPRAVEILTAAAAETPADAIVQLGLGVALSRVGRREDARAAYERALAAPDGGEAAARALYNLGTSHLADAFAAVRTLREQDAAANVEPQARMMMAQKGIEAARAAIRALRDRVRSEPSDKEAAHNLQIAQRTRRFLEEELRRQQQESGESGDQGDDGEKKDGEQKKGEQEDSGDDGQQSPQPEDGEQGEQKPDESEQGSQGDQQEGEEQKPSGSQDGDATGEEQQPQPEQGVASDGEEKKDDPLKDLLEAAARRMRVVEEMRKSKMRRVRVEKDW